MVQIRNLSFFVTNETIFSQANLFIKERDRLGLVGPNGAGKTTLLRLISGQYESGGGDIEFMGSVDIGFLQQDALEESMKIPIREIALSAFEETNKIESQLELLSDSLTNRTDYESEAYHELIDKMEHLQARYDLLEGHRKEAKTDEVLEGLGFKTKDLSEPLSKFSGGWRMRVLLAKLLLKNPKLLLLDEPTNHLDIDSIVWLEKYLANYKGAVVIVSHDRWFLDRMVDRIAEIRNKRIYEYTGNYEDYLSQRTEQVEQQRREYEAQQREIDEMERFITRFRAKATKAKQVQSRVKELERLVRVEEPEPEQSSISFRFNEPPRSGKVVLEVKNLKKTYNKKCDNETVVFTSGQQLHVERGDKIAMIGPNGAGKSTLARILYGNEPFDGELITGHNVIPTFFAQHLSDVLDSKRTVLEELETAATTSETRVKIRTLLGCFLFQGDDVFKPVKVLSGGERSRLALAKSLLQPANLLVLDEPTNHLDIQSKEILVQALKEYEGTILLISHDRYFLRGIAKKIWRISDGKVDEYDGGFDYYEWKSQKETDEQFKSKSFNTNAQNGLLNNQQKVGQDIQGPKTKERKRQEAEFRNRVHKETQALKKEIRKLEKLIEELEVEKSNISQKMEDPDFYQTAEAGTMIKRFSEIETKINRLTDQWAEMQERLEVVEENIRAELDL